MKKKLICILVCAFVFLGFSFAQTMTRFGVVDTARVYSTYFRDSAAVRNYEQKKAEFQKRINEKTEELKTIAVSADATAAPKRRGRKPKNTSI